MTAPGKLQAIVVAPSYARTYSLRAFQVNLMDIHFGPGQVLTCREDQVKSFVRTLTK